MKRISSLLSFILFHYLHIAQTTNIDFESTPVGTYTSANAVSGWTISSQINTSSVCSTSTVWNAGSPEFSIVSTPIAAFPVIGNILQSPLGGSNVARINNSTANGTITKLSRTYSVTSTNSLLKIAWAGLWQDSHVFCCENASFYLLLKNQSGSLLSCSNVSMATGPGCQSSIGFSTTPAGSYWTNWQEKDIDLSFYVNSNITIEIISSDCAYGDHFGTVFFDADFPYTPPPISYCQGNYFGIATVTAPSGYTSYIWDTQGMPINYMWGSPAQIIYAQGVYPGLTYTVVMNQYSACSQTVVYTFTNTPTVINSVKTRTTCSNGSIGSATLFANATGYSWINSTGSVVSTSSVLNNVPAGSYTATAIGCNSTSTIISIGTGTPGPSTILKPFCNAGTYLDFSTGMNHQWYYHNTAITPSLGGTSSIYTVTSPANLDTIVVGYDSGHGCRDSVNIILVSITPGTVAVSSNSQICKGSTNGVSYISLIPSWNSPTGTNSFSIIAAGATTAIGGTTSASTFTALGLTAGEVYSINVSDGACNYSTTYTTPCLKFDYSLANGSPTICSGNSQSLYVNAMQANFQTSYTYSWSPSTFLYTTTFPNTMITPTISSGAVSTIIYSVMVTSNSNSCVVTKTTAITIANPETPTLNIIPPLCITSNPFTITATPLGGVYLNMQNSVDSITGILTPSLANLGQNTYTYVNAIGSCVAKTSGVFTVNALPILSIAGNTAVCEGQATTLLATGADTYTWSTSQTSPFISVNPLNTTTYSLAGTNAISSCSNTSGITVSVVFYPSITIMGNTSICRGNATTLTALGANAYVWNTNAAGQNIVVSPSVTTTYTVIGTSALANCASTQLIAVVVSDCDLVGLPDHFANEDMRLYPNPTHNKIFIETDKEITLSIRDGLGKIILEDVHGSGGFSLDLSGFAAGVYFLHITKNGKAEVIKLIKTEAP